MLNKLKLLNKRKILFKLNLNPKKYLLLTIHRQENTDNLENLKSILLALIAIKEKIVFPIHPRTKKSLRKIKELKDKDFKNFLLIEPISYLGMLALEKNARKILTDSGGVQQEAYWLEIPCITLRNETEWVETMESGWNITAGTKADNIIKAIKDIKVEDYTYLPYGKGNAAIKIVGTLMAQTSHKHI